METTKEELSAQQEVAERAPGPRRVIKRYSNRKLYDTRDSKYVTLQQIGEMVRAGEEVQIIDNKTKEDKTEVTLALILSEDLKSQPRSVPLAALRDLIQERGGRLLNQLRENTLGSPLMRDGILGRFIPSPDGKPVEGAAEAAPPPPSSAEGGPNEQPRMEDKRTSDRPEEKKGRLSELMETSLASLVPSSAKSYSELREEVQRLTERVEQLERALSIQHPAPPPADAG